MNYFWRKLVVLGFVLLCSCDFRDPNLPAVMDPTHERVYEQLRDRGGYMRVSADGFITDVDPHPDYDFTITDDDLRALSKCSEKLERLNLRWFATEVTDAGISDLLGHCPSIKELYVKVRSRDALSAICENSSLEDLGLICHLHNDDLALLSNLKNLKKLSLDGAPFTGEVLSHLPHLPNLTSLNFRIAENIGPALARLDRVPELRFLGFSRFSSSTESLSELPTFANLERLWINSCNLADNHLEPIIRHSGLTEINLINTELTASGLRQLLTMPKLKILEVRIRDSFENVEQVVTEFPGYAIDLEELGRGFTGVRAQKVESPAEVPDQ